MAPDDQDILGFSTTMIENKHSAFIEFSGNQNPFDHSENVKSLVYFDKQTLSFQDQQVLEQKKN